MSVFLSVRLPGYLSICLSICLPVPLFVSMSDSESICLYASLSGHCMYGCLDLSDFLSLGSACLQASVDLSVYLSGGLSAWLSLCIFAHLAVYVFL